MYTKNKVSLCARLKFMGCLQCSFIQDGFPLITEFYFKSVMRRWMRLFTVALLFFKSKVKQKFFYLFSEASTSSRQHLVMSQDWRQTCILFPPTCISEYHLRVYVIRVHMKLLYANIIIMCFFLKVKRVSCSKIPSASNPCNRPGCSSKC